MECYIFFFKRQVCKVEHLAGKNGVVYVLPQHDSLIFLLRVQSYFQRPQSNLAITSRLGRRKGYRRLFACTFYRFSKNENKLEYIRDVMNERHNAEPIFPVASNRIPATPLITSLSPRRGPVRFWLLSNGADARAHTLRRLVERGRRGHAYIDYGSRGGVRDCIERQSHNAPGETESQVSRLLRPSPFRPISIRRRRSANSGYMYVCVCYRWIDKDFCFRCGRCDDSFRGGRVRVQMIRCVRK